MSLIAQLASYDDDISFRRLWRVGYVLSAVAVAVSVGALGVRGLNLGIDFEGGTSWLVPNTDVSVSEARDALGSVGLDGAKIQVIGSDTLRVQDARTDDETVAEVKAALADLTGVPEGEIADSTVGPTWGDEISSAAYRALAVFFVAVAFYIAIRLTPKMAVGALLAMAHDIVVSVGVYAVFQFEVTPATVIAFLTILGYSLYDTIVVFDKANENASRPSLAQRMTYTDLMSLSLNQVLMRSLNTTITSVIPVLAMLVVGSLILGAVTLQEFSVALLVGLLLGGYSSIFVAAPAVSALREREPANQALARRLAAQEARRGGRSADETPGSTGTGPSGAAVGEAPELSGRTIPPRPRKKTRRP